MKQGASRTCGGLPCLTRHFLNWLGQEGEQGEPHRLRHLQDVPGPEDAPALRLLRPQALRWHRLVCEHTLAPGHRAEQARRPRGRLLYAHVLLPRRLAVVGPTGG